MLQDMFGDDAVPKVFKGDKFVVTVDGKRANIDLTALVMFKIEPFIELKLILFSISRRWNVMKTLVFNKWFKLLYLNYINL
jgi:cleavage and polyadenylation specificity factor subunit 3